MPIWSTSSVKLIKKNSTKFDYFWYVTLLPVASYCNYVFGERKFSAFIIIVNIARYLSFCTNQVLLLLLYIISKVRSSTVALMSFQFSRTIQNIVRILLMHCFQAKRNREIAALQRKIDEMPTRAELGQYQKRFLELYNQGQWTQPLYWILLAYTILSLHTITVSAFNRNHVADFCHKALLYLL